MQKENIILKIVKEIPGSILCVTQIVLLLRFCIFLFNISGESEVISMIYLISDIIVLPIRLVLEEVKIKNGTLLSEALLFSSTGWYISLYTGIIFIVRKITFSKDEE